MGCHADSRSVTFGHVRCANMRLIVRICISQHRTGGVRRTASGKGMETIKTRESLHQRGNEQKSEND